MLGESLDCWVPAGATARPHASNAKVASSFEASHPSEGARRVKSSGPWGPDGVLNQHRGWLIAYDVVDRKRLARLHRSVRGFALPVQYSLFYFECSSKQLLCQIEAIAHQIDPREDDVRVYPVPASPQLWVFGRGGLPSGVWIESPAGFAANKLLRGWSD